MDKICSAFVRIYCRLISKPEMLNVICPVASAESRRRLRSASSTDLIVPATRRTTMGDRAFAVAVPRAWNSLPDVIRHSPSLNVFKCSLKTHHLLRNVLLTLLLTLLLREHASVIILCPVPV